MQNSIINLANIIQSNHWLFIYILVFFVKNRFYKSQLKYFPNPLLGSEIG